MSSSQSEVKIDVNDAASIVVFAGAIGGAFGYLFTVHLVESFASELEAVWLTTVTFAVVGLYLWSYLRQ